MANKKYLSWQKKEDRKPSLALEFSNRLEQNPDDFEAIWDEYLSRTEKEER